MENRLDLRLFLNQNFVEKLFHKKNLSGKTKKPKQNKIHGRRILSFKVGQICWETKAKMSTECAETEEMINLWKASSDDHCVKIITN